jgi:serine/threonine-protein kinase
MDAIPDTIGPYRIEREIARGGMGIVYLAHDTRLKRAAAIKALPDDVASDRDRLARFRQEAQILASLSHPNVAGIYGLEESGGRSYLVLEHIEGETLADRVARGALPIDESVEICLQIAAGVEAAHKGGIIHRDLKPGNVMITPNGVVKVLDFGLAKGKAGAASALTSESSPALTGPPETMPGVILGTAAYLSPEQSRGWPVDRRTDIWSFGCILFECLTGKVAFEGQTVSDTIAKILLSGVDWARLPKETPSRVRDLLQRCLERDSSQRLGDIGEARRALEELKGGPGSMAVAPAGGDRPKALVHRLLPVAAAVLIAALGLYLWNAVGPGKRRPSQRPLTGHSLSVPDDAAFSAETPSIAVLPFSDLSPARDQEYFADGLSEELINVLANIRGLRVVSRTSAFSFKGKDVDLATVAQKLNVAMILEGSVRKAGKQLRVTAQLIRVATDSHLWSQTYDRPLEDVFAVQEDIAQSVVKGVRATLGGRSLDSTAVAAAEAEVVAAGCRWKNADAYQLYLQGRFYAERGSQTDMVKAIDFFRQGLRLEPRSAMGWAALSGAHSQQAGLGYAPLDEGYRLAREEATRSLKLEPDCPDGHLALGGVQLEYDWDWKGAESSLRRALELAPGDGGVLWNACNMAMIQGRPDEMVALGRRGLALDPVSASAHRLFGILLLDCGFLDEAEAELKEALDLSPGLGMAYLNLALTHQAQGRGEEAMREIEKESFEDSRLWGTAIVYHANGRAAESDAALRMLIEKYAQGDASQIATVYAYRGELDRSFEWLERAYKQRDAGLAEVKVNPFLRNLHADARWKPFLGKMRLAD